MLSGRLRGPRCSLRSVDHGDNVHLVGLDMIDDSVGAFQNFPYLRELYFRDDADGLGKAPICWERLVRRSTILRAYSGELCPM